MKKLDLKPFCAWPESKYSKHDLLTPWVKGGFEYASDCVVCIEVPTDKPDTMFRSVPNAAATLGFSPKRGWKPWPAHRLELIKMCRLQFGDGIKTPVAVQCIGKVVIDAVYDCLIRPLPNVEYVVKGDSVFFRFDGGRGAVMIIGGDE